MSWQLVAVIGQFSPEQEIYSSDESFVRFAGFDHWDQTAHGRTLRARVLRWTGLPVGVAIGPTKTLAKLANRLAKQHPDFQAEGACNLQIWSQRRQPGPCPRRTRERLRRGIHRLRPGSRPQTAVSAPLGRVEQVLNPLARRAPFTTVSGRPFR